MVFSVLGSATYVVLVFASRGYKNVSYVRTLDCKFETVEDFSSEKICEDKREVAKYLVDCLINNLCDTGSGEGEDPFRTE